jgi:hypothetical protein
LTFGFENERFATRPRLDRSATSSELLAQTTFAAIEAHAASGRDLFGRRLFSDARQELLAALEALPPPIHRWNAAGWLLAALGECAWQYGAILGAKQFLSNALNAPGTVGNAFVHLRFGQALFELRDQRARLELRQALTTGGPEIFVREDPSYHAFVLDELIPSVGEPVFDAIRGKLAACHNAAADHETVAAIFDSSKQRLVVAALAGSRVAVVMASSPKEQAAGELTSAGLVLVIEDGLVPRDRIVLCNGIVRRGELREGAQLKRAT